MGLDPPVARRIADKLRWLAENAAVVHHLPLSGQLAGAYKLRVGDWRAVYQLLQDERIVLVLRLGHRREVYEE
ncbi:MAG TPA: type II toxin-antitoxin system RelE/ParE family toxin [Thermoanaerobaculia bacterium]|nr:type II toxin-antitoxin system RelE/ParE family toxin [Thermoanaerobaculia bacterium]